MMHESVTNSPSPANFFQHNKSDDLLSNNQAKAMNARDMLAASGGASRRPQSVGFQKPERSGRPVAANANGGGRWRYNNSGQLVDSVSSEWDVADDMVKLQITDDASDRKAQRRTPPHLRGSMGVVGVETSPLETSSETSLGSESPNAFDQSGALGSHSRGSSADTTGSSHPPAYSSGQTLQAGPYTPLKASGVGESRNRPHSYSGGLSTAELLRLSNVGGSPGVPEMWTSPNGTPERQPPSEQPTYPSLASQNGPSRSQEALVGSRAEDSRSSFDAPARPQFATGPQGPAVMHGAAAPPYATGRPTNVVQDAQFRQRAFSPQVPPVLQSPPNFAYPAPLPMSVTGGQQLYDMMLPTPPLENPAMARLQQQAPYRGVHQHSASDPASLRDPAMLALLNSNMQAAFAAGQMYGPTGLVPPAMAMFNQFYPGAEGYPSPDLAMIARLQPQFTGQYGVPPAQGLPVAANQTLKASVPTAGSPSGLGPNANNRKLGLYKTELCRSWEEKGTCRYSAKCQFAHGEEELRLVQRHPKYKTEICRTFWVSGSCPYGKRCCFIHTELPGSAPLPGQDNSPSHVSGETRARSDSDPNEGSTSLLARISAKRQEPLAANKAGSLSTTPPSAGFGGRPGSLRVDTSVLDPNAAKQNKSAFPTFTHNGILVSSNEEPPAMSPGPVTAAPDFGRHAAARMDIVGTQRPVRKANVDPNVRHSFNGGEIQLDLSASTPTAPNQGQFGLASDVQSARALRVNGHVRSGSAGNWASATRTANHLTAYPLSSIPGGELKSNNMPWADYSSSRRTENNWA